MGRRALRHSVFALWLVACFDPLYEDGAPLDSHWVLCCPGGVPATCFCQEATSCRSSIYACGENRCSVTPYCSVEGDGGSAMGQDAGAAMGGGGGAGGGTGGGGQIGSGGGTSVAYEFCCASGRVRTCACPSSSCTGAPFTPCANGGCVEGTTSGACP